MFGSTSCNVGGTWAEFFSWNTLVCPKQPLQIQSFTSRFPLISIRRVLINLIWFRYQNIGRFGFVLSHMWRPLDCCTKTSFFIQFGNFLKTNITFYHSFLLFKGKLLFIPRDVTMTDQHFWSAMFHLQLMGRSLDYLWSKTSGCCSLFSLSNSFCFRCLRYVWTRKVVYGDTDGAT